MQAISTGMVIKLNVRSLHSYLFQNLQFLSTRLSFKLQCYNVAVTACFSATGTADQDIVVRKIFNAPEAPLI